MAHGIGAALLVVVGFGAGRADAQEVKWRGDYAAARKEATDSGRPLLLDFGTEDCFYCRKLDATTFRAPAIAKALNEQFIPVKIDAERAAALTRALGVDSYPTLILASADGRILARHVGYADITQMNALLGKVVATAPGAAAPPVPAKPGPADALAQARVDHDAGRYLACLERCERLVAAHPQSAEAAEARQLAQRIAADPQKWRRVQEQLDAELAGLKGQVNSPLER
jgi:thioredoxin-like negative regulator of GroEL